jgi:hypothetical protein
MREKYPNKASAIYTEHVGLRVEEELKRKLETLKETSAKDIPECIRIKLRELVKELEAS